MASASSGVAARALVSGLPVESYSLSFCPFVPTMLTTAVVLELDDFLRSIDRGGAHLRPVIFFVEIFRFMFPNLHWFSL